MAKRRKVVVSSFRWWHVEEATHPLYTQTSVVYDSHYLVSIVEEACRFDSNTVVFEGYSKYCHTFAGTILHYEQGVELKR